jgi:ribosomal-protein-alanine N-acetyltransferase
MTPPRLTTARLVLTLPPPEAAKRFVAFVRDNRDHFAPWDPPPDPEVNGEAYWSRRLLENRADFDRGASCRLALFLREAPEGDVVGTASLTNVLRGPLQSAALGYKIAKPHEGKGLMREALEAVIRFGFDELCLHRICANYQPTNERSGALLRRLGFVVEGYARDYLYVGGAWKDHVLTALVNPRWTPRPIERAT